MVQKKRQFMGGCLPCSSVSVGRGAALCCNTQKPHKLRHLLIFLLQTKGAVYRGWHSTGKQETDPALEDPFGGLRTPDGPCTPQAWNLCPLGP